MGKLTLENFIRQKRQILRLTAKVEHPKSIVLPVGLKWPHPIPVPESGCVLIATMKLDGVCSFERTVLLLRSGTRHPQKGPFAVVINRALHKKIRHMKPINLELATTCAECSLHFGGPLEASMFLLKTGVLTCDPSIYPRALHVPYCNYIRTLRLFSLFMRWTIDYLADI